MTGRNASSQDEQTGIYSRFERKPSSEINCPETFIAARLAKAVFSRVGCVLIYELESVRRSRCRKPEILVRKLAANPRQLQTNSRLTCAVTRPRLSLSKSVWLHDEFAHGAMVFKSSSNLRARIARKQEINWNSESGDSKHT